MKPMWLLDVDGVLNATSEHHDREPGWCKAHVQMSNTRMTIRWRHKLADLVGTVAKHGLVDVRWLTSWQDDASVLLGELMNLPPIATLGPRGTAGAKRSWWKFDVVLAHTPPNVPLIWTDDHLYRAHRHVTGFTEWAALRTAPTLLISPNHRHGLMQPEVQRIVDFINLHQDKD